MSDIRRRINTIEKTLKVGRHEQPPLSRVVVCIGPPDKATAEEQDEPGVIRIILSKKVCDEAGLNEADVQPKVCREAIQPCRI